MNIIIYHFFIYKLFIAEYNFSMLRNRNNGKSYFEI